MSVELRTPRLRLVACDADLLERALVDPQSVGPLVDARVPITWPAQDLRDALPHMIAEMQTFSRPGWGVWLVIDAETNTIIGDAGFAGPPSPTVEIGYSILGSHRRRGYAAEAARALVAWAFEQGATAVRATTEVDNEPSIRLLKRLGMQPVDAGGPLLSFELREDAHGPSAEGRSPSF